jgi:hypothetical protein
MALMQQNDDIIPVRGPASFAHGEWKYALSVTGDLTNFSGQEEVSLHERPVYRLSLHGGLLR